MTPIYFPFTFMPQTLAEMLKTCFPKVSIYLPSASGVADAIQKSAAEGFFDLRIPIREDNEKLESIVREYQDWAQLHQGQDLSFFKTRKESVPFYDEFSVQQIRSEIRQKEGKKEVQEGPDPLFQARIFLRFCQEYDIRQWELGSDLEFLGGLEKNLLQELHGEADISESEIAPRVGPLIAKITKDDAGAHMCGERLRAWARLLQSDPPSSRLFLTSSRSVLDMVAERTGGAQEVLRVEGISLNPDAVHQWQEALAECLERISETETIEEAERLPASENTSGGFALVFYRVSCPDTEEFLRRIANPKAAGETEPAKKNVLIGWVGENGAHSL